VRAITDYLGRIYDITPEGPHRGQRGGVIIWYGQRVVERYFLEPGAESLSLPDLIVRFYKRKVERSEKRQSMRVIRYEFEKGYSFENCDDLLPQLEFLRTATQPSATAPATAAAEPRLPPQLRGRSAQGASMPRASVPPATGRGYALHEPKEAVQALRELVRRADAFATDGISVPTLYLFWGYGITFLCHTDNAEILELLGFLNGLPERLYHFGHLMVFFTHTAEQAQTLKAEMLGDSPFVWMIPAPEPDEENIFARLMSEQFRRERPDADAMACADQAAAWLRRHSEGRDRLFRSLYDRLAGRPLGKVFLDSHAVRDVEGILLNLDLEDLRRWLREQVYNQDHAINELVDALKQVKAYLHNCRTRGIPRRRGPLFKRLFAGPSGTGKSHLARCLSRRLFDRPPYEILMENVSNRTSLVGAPASYVGFGAVHSALEQLHATGSGVLLIDEWERAGSDAQSRHTIHDCFMSVFEEGQLDTEDRRHISFQDTIILVTTNLGMYQVDYDEMQRLRRYESEDRRREEYIRAITTPNHEGICIEFPWLGRLGEPVVFRAFDPDDMVRVAETEWAGQLAALLGENIIRPRVQVEGEALADAYRRCYDPRLGARNVKSRVERHVQQLLEHATIDTRVKSGGQVRVALRDGKVVIL